MVVTITWEISLSVDTIFILVTQHHILIGMSHGPVYAPCKLVVHQYCISCHR